MFFYSIEFKWIFTQVDFKLNFLDSSLPIQLLFHGMSDKYISAGYPFTAFTG